MDSDEFAAFWSRYPRKVGKLAAEKAYARARRLATAADILDGVGYYCYVIRRNQCDMRYVAHPATWLNQGRWLDEPVTPSAAAFDWFDECRRLHHGECLGAMRHNTRMLLEAARARA